MTVKKNPLYLANVLAFILIAVYSLIICVNVLNGEMDMNVGLFAVLVTMVLCVVMYVIQAAKVVEKIESNPMMKLVLEIISTAVLIVVGLVIRIYAMTEFKFDMGKEGLVIVCMLLAYASARFLNQFGFVTLLALVPWPLIMANKNLSQGQLVALTEILVVICVVSAILYFTRGIKYVDLAIYAIFILAVVGYVYTTMKNAGFVHEFAENLMVYVKNVNPIFAIDGIEKIYCSSLIMAALIASFRLLFGKGNAVSMVIFPVTTLVLFTLYYNSGSALLFVIYPLLAIVVSGALGTRDDELTGMLGDMLNNVVAPAGDSAQEVIDNSELDAILAENGGRFNPAKQTGSEKVGDDVPIELQMYDSQVTLLEEAKKKEDEMLAAQKAKEEEEKKAAEALKAEEEARYAALKAEEEARLAALQAEEEARLAALKAEEEARLAAVKEEEERLAAQKAELERLAAEAEAEKMAAMKAEADRLALEKERLAAEKAAAEAKAERLAMEKLAMEQAVKAEAEKAAAIQAETERQKLAAIQAAAVIESAKIPEEETPVFDEPVFDNVEEVVEDVAEEVVEEVEQFASMSDTMAMPGFDFASNDVAVPTFEGFTEEVAEVEETVADTMDQVADAAEEVVEAVVDPVEEVAEEVEQFASMSDTMAMPGFDFASNDVAVPTFEGFTEEVAEVEETVADTMDQVADVAEEVVETVAEPVEEVEQFASMSDAMDMPGFDFASNDVEIPMFEGFDTEPSSDTADITFDSIMAEFAETPATENPVEESAVEETPVVDTYVSTPQFETMESFLSGSSGFSFPQFETEEAAPVTFEPLKEVVEEIVEEVVPEVKEEEEFKLFDTIIDESMQTEDDDDDFYSQEVKEEALQVITEPEELDLGIDLGEEFDFGGSSSFTDLFEEPVAAFEPVAEEVVAEPEAVIYEEPAVEVVAEPEAVAYEEPAVEVVAEPEVFEYEEPAVEEVVEEVVEPVVATKDDDYYVYDEPAKEEVAETKPVANQFANDDDFFDWNAVDASAYIEEKQEDKADEPVVKATSNEFEEFVWTEDMANSYKVASDNDVAATAETTAKTDSDDMFAEFDYKSYESEVSVATTAEVANTSENDIPVIEQTYEVAEDTAEFSVFKSSGNTASLEEEVVEEQPQLNVFQSSGNFSALEETVEETMPELNVFQSSGNLSALEEVVEEVMPEYKTYGEEVKEAAKNVSETASKISDAMADFDLDLPDFEPTNSTKK